MIYRGRDAAQNELCAQRAYAHGKNNPVTSATLIDKRKVWRKLRHNNPFLRAGGAPTCAPPLLLPRMAGELYTGPRGAAGSRAGRNAHTPRGPGGSVTLSRRDRIQKPAPTARAYPCPHMAGGCGPAPTRTGVRALSALRTLTRSAPGAASPVRPNGRGPARWQAPLCKLPDREEDTHTLSIVYHTCQVASGARKTNRQPAAELAAL